MYHIQVAIQHWKEEDTEVVKDLLSNYFIYGSYSVSYWRSIVPPNGWSIKLGPYTKEGCDRQLAGLKEFLDGRVVANISATLERNAHDEIVKDLHNERRIPVVREVPSKKDQGPDST